MNLSKILKDIASEPLMSARDYVRLLFAILFSLSWKRIEAREFLELSAEGDAKPETDRDKRFKY